MTFPGPTGNPPGPIIPLFHMALVSLHFLQALPVAVLEEAAVAAPLYAYNSAIIHYTSA